MGEEKEEPKKKSKARRLLNIASNVFLIGSIAYAGFVAGMYAHMKKWVLFLDEMESQKNIPSYIHREYAEPLDLHVAHHLFHVSDLEASLRDYELRDPAVAKLVSMTASSTSMMNGLLFDNYLLTNAHGSDTVSGRMSFNYAYDPYAKTCYPLELVACATGADLSLYRLRLPRGLGDNSIIVAPVDRCEDWRVVSVDYCDHEEALAIIRGESPDLDVSSWSMHREIYTVPEGNHSSLGSNLSFSYTQEWLMLPNLSEGGRSGSPIYDSEGNLIGLVSGSTDTAATAIPGQVIRKFFDAILER